MFAIKSESKPTKENKSDHKNITNKLLLVYKKIKNIARTEINSKNKFKLANLKNDQLTRIKSIEYDMDLCLVAYETDRKKFNQKIQILTKMNMLLNDYSNLIEKDNSNDDFSKFFE